MIRRIHLVVAVVVAVLPLVACHRPLPIPPGLAGPPDEVREVTLAGGFLTVRLEIPPLPAGPKPAVISPLQERDLLLQSGAVVVTYQLHWELLAGLVPKPVPGPEAPKNTVGLWLLASPTAATIGQGYLGLIDGEATDTIPQVVDYLVTVPEIDPTRIGLAGASTNGFKTLQAIAHDRRIAAAVVVSACGDYHCFLHLSSLALKGEQPLALDKGYEAWLRPREPLQHPQRLTRTALLMVNGTEDTAIPYECARKTEHVFRRAYRRAGAGDRFRAVAIPGGGHNLADQASLEALAWWFRWLLPPGAPPPHGD